MDRSQEGFSEDSSGPIYANQGEVEGRQQQERNPKPLSSGSKGEESLVSGLLLRVETQKTLDLVPWEDYSSRHWCLNVAVTLAHNYYC